MSSLYIHIGNHKTGSTAIQDFMHGARDELAPRGLLYPTAGLDGSGHHEFARACGQGKNTLDTDYIQNVCQEIRNEYRDGAENILFSSEIFEYLQDLSPLKALAEQFSPKIIIYIRKQDYYLESLYNQHVRMYSIRFSGSVYQFSQRYNLFHQYNYNQLVTRWADLFGASNIILRPYGTNLVNTDVTADILSVIDPDLEDSIRSKGASDRLRSNVSLAAQAMPYLSYLNRLPLDRDQHEMLVSVLEQRFSDEAKGRLLLEEDAASFYDKFRLSNQKVFSKYSCYQGNPFDELTAKKSEKENWVSHEQIQVRMLMDLVKLVI